MTLPKPNLCAKMQPMTHSPDTITATPAPIGAQATPSGEATLNPTDLAHKIVELAEDKQALDITLLDLREISVLADYFVICTAESSRQTVAILDSVAIELKKEGLLPLHPVEGDPGAGWSLIDYADVVLHVFDAATRSYYNLEQLWKDAPVVLKIQ